MEKSEMIYIASKAFEKGIDYETLHYSDDMNGRENFTEEVYAYVEECMDIGRKAWREKYKEYKLY